MWQVKAKIVKAKAKYYAKYKHPPSTQVPPPSNSPFEVNHPSGFARAC